MTQYVEIQGESLAVEIYEPNEHRSDVLLIHGFTGSKEDFSEVGALIARAGFRVITFDNRGQNESSHTKRDDGYSMKSLGKDALEIAKHFNLKNPHLLGHSFGGLIAQQAITIDSNFWSSLTLMCSGPGGRRNWLSEPHFVDLNNETKSEIWSRVMEKDRLGNPRFELLKSRWLASDADSTMIYRNHLRYQESLIPELSKLNLAAHVIYGENDDAWPIKEQNEMARELGAELTVLPGCGHCPNEENPELLAKELIRFWNSI